jgi:V/A-type H+-transporting ATPase subunit I
MLGSAFNNLAGMVLGESVITCLPYVVILIFGHVLTVLMASLGAFVHPMRLTFVEYFKNAGYEGRGTEYNPLKK